MTKPEAYWPLEDGASATSGAPGTAGQAIAAAGVVFGAFTTLAGATQTPNLLAGRLVGTIGGVSATSWHAELAVNVPYLGAAIARVYTSSPTYSVFRIFTPSAVGSNVQVFITDPDGVPTATLLGPAVVAGWDNTWHHIAITATQVGASITTQLIIDGILQATDTSVGTLAAPTTFLGNQNGTTLTSMSHIAIGSGTTVSNAAALLNGGSGEQAHVRLIRLSAEEGVPFTTLASSTVVMGPQPAGTFVELCRLCEAVDQGVLYEVAWGLGYQSLAERTNEPVSLVLDFAKRHIADDPQPADDDQRLRNLWIAMRPGGSEATSEQLTGPLRTGPGGPGVYKDSVTVNVQTDAQLPDQAGWRRHLGTVDEDRWPSVPVHLHSSTDLIDAWTAMPFGGRLTIANPLSQIAPDTIDAIREGWTERWDAVSWDIELATSPFSPYRTGVLAADTGDTNEFLLILTPDTLTLAAGVSTTGVTWSINSSPLWTTNVEYFPRYILWEGEVVQLTACTGASAPQTWTVTRSVNGVVKSHLANSSGSVYRPGVLALV